MSELLTHYFDLLAWLAANTVKSLVVLLVQYIIIMKIHYKVHNVYYHAILSIWFLPQDFIVNTVLFSIIGLEYPREYTVTSRLKRWKKLQVNQPLGMWRYMVATKLCNILNMFDKDGHC